MPHRNAPLTETGRLRLARCVVDDGWPLRRAAERFQVSPSTAHRWAERYRALGEAGMTDRSSRPHTSPRRTPSRTERRIIKVRVLRRWGLARIAHLFHLNPPPGPDPLRPGPPHPPRPRHRPRHPPLRTRPARRTRPRRHQETRQHPRRRRPQSPGPGGRQPQQLRPPRHRPAPKSPRPPQPGLELPAHRRRRPLTPGLQRDPPRRATAHRHRLLDPRTALLHPGQDHRGTRPDRQRLLLPLPPVARHPGSGRDHPQTNPPLPATDERQSRTLQPHPARRMGLRKALPLRTRTT